MKLNTVEKIDMWLTKRKGFLVGFYWGFQFGFIVWILFSVLVVLLKG